MSLHDIDLLGIYPQIGQTRRDELELLPSICMHVNELYRFFKSRNVINNPHGSLLLHPKEDQPNNNATLLRDICHHLHTRGSMHGICFRVSRSRKTFRRCRVGFSSLRFGNYELKQSCEQRLNAFTTGFKVALLWNKAI